MTGFCVFAHILGYFTCGKLIFAEQKCILSVSFGPQYVLHAASVYLHLYLEMSSQDWIIIRDTFYCQLCAELHLQEAFFHFLWWWMGGLSEPHHHVLIFRSCCLWQRGRGSIRVSRKSQLANLQLLQTQRHPIVTMRYGNLYSKILHFYVWYQNVQNTV